MPDPAPVDPVSEDSPAANGKRRTAVGKTPDVLLDAVVNVDEIKLDVQGLKSNVSVLAEVAGLVKLQVGADVSVERVTLTIRGVAVTALLEVRLDQVRLILDKALTTLIENPEILEILAKTVVDVVREVGDVITPVVEGVVTGVVAPVVQGVVGPVVQGVVRGVGVPVVPPAPGQAVGLVVPPAPGGAVGQVEQTASPPGGPATDHAGPLLDETLDKTVDKTLDELFDETGQMRSPAPGAGDKSDGVLERTIRLLSQPNNGKPS